MAARIEVEKLKEGEFGVRVIEGRSESTHRVTLAEDDYRRLSRGKDRAPRTHKAIVRVFVGRYLREYERELKREI